MLCFLLFRGRGVAKLHKNKTLYGIQEHAPLEYWNIISTIGSLEKVLTVDCRILVTYDDVRTPWFGESYDLPKTTRANVP